MGVDDAEVEITVWQADGSPWRGAHYGSEIARRLALAGHEVRTVRLEDRAPDDHELAARAHVLTGGNTSATTSRGWVARARRCLEDVLRRAESGTAAVVGICFGAQLIAATMGGESAVRESPRGMEVGLRRITCTRSGTSRAVAEFHFHEVHPKALDHMGATTIFTNDHSPVQGFAVGSGITGYQFHPELEPRHVALTAAANRKIVRANGSSTASALWSVRREQQHWVADCFDSLVTSRVTTNAPAPVAAAAAPAGVG